MIQGRSETCDLLGHMERKDSPVLAIVALVWEAVRDSSRDIAILGTWRVAKERWGTKVTEF